MLERDRMQKEKEEFERREADYLANRRTDIGYQNAEPRTVEEFIDDQIRFEQRRFDNIRQVQQREELQQIYPFHPTINPISAKIIEQKNAMNNNNSMATSMTNGNTKKIKKAEEYQRQME